MLGPERVPRPRKALVEERRKAKPTAWAALVLGVLALLLALGRSALLGNAATPIVRSPAGVAADRISMAHDKVARSMARSGTVTG